MVMSRLVEGAASHPNCVMLNQEKRIKSVIRTIKSHHTLDNDTFPDPVSDISWSFATVSGLLPQPHP